MTSQLTPLVITFLASAAVVVAAGTMLSRAADVIAARTHLGGLWIGATLLALATSLPELTTDVAAVRLGFIDLAAGDLFGSSMANMLILAIITLMPAGTELFRKATIDHVLSAALAVTLTCIAAMTILVRPGFTVLGIGPGSLVLVLIYMMGSRVVFRHSTIAREAAATVEMSDRPPEITGSPDAQSRSLRWATMTFVAAALIVLVAAPYFARTAAGIAEVTGVGSTFVGTWLVGFATSLPELVTSLTAVRLRAYDLAVGNLFGSNAFNMIIFAVLDVAYGHGPLLGAVSSVHVITAIMAVLLMSTATAALIYRARGEAALLEPGSALIVVGYVVGVLLVFSAGGHATGH